MVDPVVCVELMPGDVLEPLSDAGIVVASVVSPSGDVDALIIVSSPAAHARSDRATQPSTLRAFMDTAYHTGRMSFEDRAIAEVLAEHRILEHVVRWCIATGREIGAVVVQDEFTHDVVVKWSDGVWLVYDCT